MRDHHRKKKREQKKARAEGTIQKRNPKGVTIPNTVPFKDQILKEARELYEHEQERKKLLKGMLRGDLTMKQLACDPPKNGKYRAQKLEKNKKKNKVTKLTASTSNSTKSDSMQCD